jgi:hypothetical protein
MARSIPRLLARELAITEIGLADLCGAKTPITKSGP